MNNDTDPRLTEEGVSADLQRQPHLLLKLAENVLQVAENLRDNYFKNTATFIRHLRQNIYGVGSRQYDPVIRVTRVDDLDWSDLRGEVVTFIDGGLGNVELSNQVPILLRVGSYSVRTGGYQLAEREHFGYYPLHFGHFE